MDRPIYCCPVAPATFSQNSKKIWDPPLLRVIHFHFLVSCAWVLLRDLWLLPEFWRLVIDWFFIVKMLKDGHWNWVPVILQKLFEFSLQSLHVGRISPCFSTVASVFRFLSRLPTPPLRVAIKSTWFNVIADSGVSRFFIVFDKPPLQRRDRRVEGSEGHPQRRGGQGK